MLKLKVTFAPDSESQEEDAADIAIRANKLWFCEIGQYVFLVMASSDPDELETDLNTHAVGGTYKVAFATNDEVRDASALTDGLFHK
jgi:hypothetical protein